MDFDLFNSLNSYKPSLAEKQLFFCQFEYQEMISIFQITKASGWAIKQLKKIKEKQWIFSPVASGCKLLLKLYFQPLGRKDRYSVALVVTSLLEKTNSRLFTRLENEFQLVNLSFQNAFRSLIGLQTRSFPSLKIKPIGTRMARTGRKAVGISAQRPRKLHC